MGTGSCLGERVSKEAMLLSSKCSASLDSGGLRSVLDGLWKEASDAKAKAEASSVAPTFSLRAGADGDKGIFCFLSGGERSELAASSPAFRFCSFIGTIILLEKRMKNHLRFVLAMVENMICFPSSAKVLQDREFRAPTVASSM